MSGAGGFEGALALFQHRCGSTVVDIVGGEHGDAAVAMLGVVPREERAAERDGLVDPRESGWGSQGGT